MEEDEGRPLAAAFEVDAHGGQHTASPVGWWRQRAARAPARSFALGDSSYGDTYCGGGLSLDQALSEAGAEQMAEPLQLDALETVTPEDDAVPWAVELIERTL